MKAGQKLTVRDKSRVSQKTEDLPLEEKIEIAIFFIHHSREDIPCTDLGSGQGQYVEIDIPKSIHKMFSNSKKYYEKSYRSGFYLRFR